jgi:hypothetical protein
MKVEIVVDPSRQPAPPLSSRLNAAPAQAGATTYARPDRARTTGL